MHDARLLTCPSLFQKICRGKKISNKTIRLRHDISKINLLTIGDSASPHLESLIKKIMNNRGIPTNSFSIKNFVAQVLLEKTHMEC